jgi:hypothetical protein
LQIISTITESITREQREKFVLEAYNAWQIVEVVKGIISEKYKGINFNEYMKKIGLDEKKPKADKKAKALSKAFAEEEKKSALSIAEQIRAADKTASAGK